VPNVQWRTPDDGQRNCQKHVEFLDKNKVGKISVSVGIKKEICYNTWSHEHKIVIQAFNNLYSSVSKPL